MNKKEERKGATLKQAAKILSVFEGTPAEQIQAILGSGLLADLRDGHIADVSRHEFRFVLGLRPLAETLVNRINHTIVPSNNQSGAFRLLRDNMAEKGLRIQILNSFFENWFLDKFVEPSGGRCLHYGQLLTGINSQVIDGLGGETGAETFLSELLILLEAQKYGQRGVLFNDGRENIFFIRDIQDRLRVVKAEWDDKVWDVAAYPIESSGKWGAGCRVFW